MLLTTLSNGDKVYKNNYSITIEFSGIRGVLSTSQLNSGYREDLTGVFNFDSKPENGKGYCMNSDTYLEDLKTIASELGLNPEKSAGVTTAVSMKNVSIKTSEYRDLIVTAIITAGIEVNAGRVGDPASFYEEKGEIILLEPGTINIFLNIDGNLSPGTLARAMVTCTEAKTAAIQELMARSMYSCGIATGSGTDETVIICNQNSENTFTFAGKHSKLGELIGKTVMEGVKEALFLETGLDSKRQYSVIRRLSRFGLDDKRIIEEYINYDTNYVTEDRLIEAIEAIDNQSTLVVNSSLLAHLIDQLNWNLLEPREVAIETSRILLSICDKYKINYSFHINDKSKEKTISSIINSFAYLLARIIYRHIIGISGR